MNPLTYHTPAPGLASRQDVNRASYPYPTEEEDEKTKSDEAAWRWDEVFFLKKMNGDQSVNTGDIYHIYIYIIYIYIIYIYHIYIHIYMFKYNIYIYTWYIHYELVILNLENVWFIDKYGSARGKSDFSPHPTAPEVKAREMWAKHTRHGALGP